MTTRTALWVNAIGFQIAWTAAVAGAARGIGWIGPVAVGVFAAYQLGAGRCARGDARLVALAVAIGLAADSWLAHMHFVRYAAPAPGADFAPLWILALWANLALTLNHSLAYLQRYLPMAALFGAIGAPLSYSIAARAWHAVELAQPIATTLLTLAVLWAVATPLLCWAARSWRGEETVPRLVVPESRA